MRCVIFANGLLTEPERLRSEIHPGDLLIAADGGARACLALGLLPHVAIGDFDSLSAQELAGLEAQGVQILRHPRRKDFTDLELALEYALEQAPEEALLIGALGRRWDQTLANLLLPACCAGRGVPVRLLDGAQELHWLAGGQRLRLNGRPGDTVSLLPLQADAEGVTTNGLEYPLNDETLYFAATRGVSNRLLDVQAEVRLERGLLLCVVIHGE